MLSLLFLLIFSVICSTNASDELIIIVKPNDRTVSTKDGLVYRFIDDEKVNVWCYFTHDQYDHEALWREPKYNLSLYLRQNDGDIKKVAFNTYYRKRLINRMTGIFTFNKNDTEIVCEAVAHNEFDSNKTTIRSSVKIQNESPIHEDNREDKLFASSLEPPKISPSVFKDTGSAFAVFTCTARRQGLALISWHQIKGTKRVLLKTVIPQNFTSETIYYSSLNKTLSKSDQNTKLYCEAWYILEGPKLSNRIISTGIILAFNSTVKPTISGNTHVLSPAKWLAILGSILVVAIIIMVILIKVILNYKRKVKKYERDEALRNRPPMTPPPSNDVYETVYGHGAGFKRPTRTRQ